MNGQRRGVEGSWPGGTIAARVVVVMVVVEMVMVEMVVMILRIIINTASENRIKSKWRSRGWCVCIYLDDDDDDECVSRLVAAQDDNPQLVTVAMYADINLRQGPR